MSETFTIPTQGGGVYLPQNTTLYVTYLYLVGNQPQLPILQGVN